jgi:hypothetical protein
MISVKNVTQSNYGLDCSTVPLFSFKKLGKYVNKVHVAGVWAEFISLDLQNMKQKV